MMPGSDGEDSGFGSVLALPSTQTGRIGSAGPASGKKTQTRARLQACSRRRRQGARLQACSRFLGEGVGWEPRAGAPETRGKA